MANEAGQNRQAPSPDRQIIESLARHGLLENPDAVQFERLTGGISSDIWKVSVQDRTYCVKRALPQLRVEAEWAVSVERNRFEVAWCRIANEIVPGSAPRILAHDEEAQLCAMSYLDPKFHRLWKNELRDGRTDLDMAAQVGTRLGQIHSACAGDSRLEQQFPRSTIFKDIRLSPYLEATADKHPDLVDRLYFLSETTANTIQTLIHGDISPKKHSPRAGRTRISGCRVCVPWRSGIRSRFLPETFSTQMPLDTIGNRWLFGEFFQHDPGLSPSGRLGGKDRLRAAHGSTASRTFPRKDRWKVTG